MDSNTILDITFKKSINKGFTAENKREYLEPYSLKTISPNQIKMQLGDIPESILTPILGHYYGIDGLDNGLVKADDSVLYYDTMEFNLVLGTNTFKIDSELSLIPPYSHSGFYKLVIKDPNGDVIPNGLNDMYIDYDLGSISFIDGIPSTVTTSISVECWLYVGYELSSNTPKQSDLPSSIIIQLTTETLPTNLSWDGVKFTYIHSLELLNDPICVVKENNTILNTRIDIFNNSVIVYSSSELLDSDNVYLTINNIIK